MKLKMDNGVTLIIRAGDISDDSDGGYGEIAERHLQSFPGGFSMGGHDPDPEMTQARNLKAAFGGEIIAAKDRKTPIAPPGAVN